MASQTVEPATNEQIVRLLEEIRTQLADVKRQQDQIARDLSELLDRE
jgi:archaellum component FlaC